jgi:hypothetical protein
MALQLCIDTAIENLVMGLRGPCSTAWRMRQQSPEPAPSRAALRQQAALDRLQRLAHGTGLTIVSYEAGRFAIVGKVDRIEALIQRERS